MSYKGRYIKILKSFKQGLTVGKYYKVTDSCVIAPYVKDDNNNRSAISTNRFNYRGEAELLPQDFNPNNINNEIQYEIC